MGESQANVFFTSWIAFISTAMNLGVWRESANLPKIVLGSYRETSLNWMWTMFFSSIFAGAATDIYYNRDEIVLQFRGQTLDLIKKDWIIILCVVWTEVGICILAIILNESLDDSWQMPCWVDRPNRNLRYRCVFGWRHVEGLVILVATGAKFWVILEYTAVDGVIPGLSNGYFGVWGSFLNGVFCLGTWLRENRHIETVVREDSQIMTTPTEFFRTSHRASPERPTKS